MRRLALITALAALAVPGAAHAQAPPLRAKLASCLSGPDAGDRTAVFTGSMPATKGTRRMWMRFDLLARGGPASGFAPLRVPGLGVWQKSVPGHPVGFVFTQRVQALVAPGAYKAVVRFRWYGKGGRLLRSARRESGVCRQSDQRPDLRVASMDAVPGPQPGQATYRLLVRNDGPTDAAPFGVLLRLADVDQPVQRVARGVEARARLTLSFVAPRCAPGSMVRFALDVGGELDEADEANNVLERVCPLLA